MFDSPRHMCLIYEGPPSSLLKTIVPVAIEKLSKNHRCLFLGSPSLIESTRSALKMAGVDTEEKIREGSVILSSDQSHLKDAGVFKPEEMLRGLVQMVNQALADGYTGLWATGDMTWELGGEDNLAVLLKYECGLETVFRTTPGLSGICQYSKETLPLYILGDALLTHPAVYINHTLHRVNPFYTPPESILSRTVVPSSGTAQKMLDQLEAI